VHTLGELVVDQPVRAAAEDEDARLVRETLSGDRAAFDVLVQRHWRKVGSVASRFLRDSNDVEDAVQETFLQAYRHLRGFRGQASVQTWLIRIAVNVCKNRLQAPWWRRVTLQQEVEPPASEDPQAIAEASMMCGQFTQALDQLPGLLRTPFVLRFLEDLSGAEIAAILGWNESTVWSRVYAARRELRKRLGSLLEE
jgi:RNA polymerase sigma-70 factor (ECF subfamily)